VKSLVFFWQQFGGNILLDSGKLESHFIRIVASTDMTKKKSKEEKKKQKI
jgi:hypothetical protein